MTARKRLHWFKEYLTSSYAMRTFYAVCAAHAALQLLLVFSVKEYELELVVIIGAFLLTGIALGKFLYRLYQYSATEYFPQDIFTYEVVKSAVGFAFTAVLAIPSAQLLYKASQDAAIAQAVPITWQGLVFVYGFSIYVWVFYLMSRLLNRSLED